MPFALAASLNTVMYNSVASPPVPEGVCVDVLLDTMWSYPAVNVDPTNLSAPYVSPVNVWSWFTAAQVKPQFVLPDPATPIHLNLPVTVPESQLFGIGIDNEAYCSVDESKLSNDMAVVARPDPNTLMIDDGPATNDGMKLDALIGNTRVPVVSTRLPSSVTVVNAPVLATVAPIAWPSIDPGPVDVIRVIVGAVTVLLVSVCTLVVPTIAPVVPCAAVLLI